MRKLVLATLIFTLATAPAAAIDLFNIKNSLIQFALEQISTEDFTIAAEEVESPGDGVTDLKGVTIADREGVWFRAESMGLQWNAGRILRGELEINQLFARGVEVLRPPKGSVTVEEDAAIAQTDDDPFDWPRAPITTRVEELRLERVFVAAGVIADQSLRFDATGAAADEGDIQSLRLDLARTDSVEGRIDLAYERDFAANTLTLDLDAREAAGGLVAALAGLPNDSASRVTVKADGPLTAWSLDFEAETERVISANGQARVDLEGRIGVTAGFEARPGPALDPTVAALMGEAARLDIDVAEDNDGVVAIRQGRFDSPALRLTAEGSYARPTGEMDLDVDLAGEAALADLAEGVAFDGVGFTGRVAGTPQDLTARGELTLDGLATAPADVGAARLATVARVQGPRVDFDVSGGAQGLRLDRLGPELVGPADLSAEGVFADQTLTLAGLTLDSRLLSAGAEGEVALGAERLGLDYRLSAPELAPIAAAYDTDAGGRIAVSGRVAGPLSAPRLTGEAELGDMVFEGEPYGRVTLSHDITAGETVTGRADLAASGSPVGPVAAAAEFTLANQRLDLSRLTAEALGATITGDVRYRLDSGLATGAVRLDAPDLAPLSRLAGAPARGAVSGRVTLEAPEGRQDAVLDLTAQGVEAFGARLARLALDGRLRDALGAPRLEAEIEAEEAGYLDAQVASIVGSLSGDDLAATPDLALDLALTRAAGFGARAGEVTLTGTVTGATTLAGVEADLAATGLAYQDITLAGLTAKLTAEDALSPLPRARLTATARRLAGPASVPETRLVARLSEAAGAARAEADLTLSRVTAGGAEIDGATLRATADDALGPDPRLDARLETGAVTAADAALAGLTARARGLLSALDVTLATEGTLSDRPLSLDAAARIDARAAAPVVRVSRLDAGLDGERVSLNAPFTVTAGGATAIRGLDLALPDGRLAGQATLHPAGLSGEIDLALGRLGLLNRLAGLPVTGGALDLSARIDTRAGRAGGTARVNARELTIEGVALEDDGALTLEAAADWDGREARLDASATGPVDEPLRLSAGVGLRPSGAMLPRVPGDGALSGRVQWQGDVGEVWALVPGADHLLEGALDVDLALSGTVAEPEFGGNLALSGGRYQNLVVGTILTDLAVTSRIEPNGDLALEAEARDGATGRVSAEVTLAGDRLSARLDSKRAVLVRRDDVKAALSIALTAEGPLTGPDIAGEVEITRAEVRLVNTMPPSVVTLGDVRIKGEPVPEPTPPAGEAIGLDIRVFANRDIFVRGRGLDSEWKADIAVAGTAARPRVSGRVERVRGALSFLGTSFELATGEVRFTGATTIDPEVAVRLEAEENGITGGIAVTGRASDPRIGFFSTPTLPEEEVMPRILYGESSQSLSAGQAIQLASGLATLLDGSGGVTDTVRGTLGLDQLAVDPTGDSASVTAGKNIGEDVFVGVEQSLDGQTSVTVEVEVLPSVTLDAKSDAEGKSSVGVRWSTDF